MGGSHAESGVETQYNNLQSYQFHTIQTIVQSRSSITLRNQAPKYHDVEEKHLLESDRLKEVANLQKYQDETRG
jgi:hypothetical protein